jgi:hypothetical protein
MSKITLFHSDHPLSIPVTEIQTSLALMLASSMFVKAPRMCRLLRFLVDKAISGTIRDTSEYIIGIEVFDQELST